MRPCSAHRRSGAPSSKSGFSRPVRCSCSSVECLSRWSQKCGARRRVPLSASSQAPISPSAGRAHCSCSRTSTSERARTARAPTTCLVCSVCARPRNWPYWVRSSAPKRRSPQGSSLRWSPMPISTRQSRPSWTGSWPHRPKACAGRSCSWTSPSATRSSDNLQLEAQCFGECAATEDFVEGVSAFVEKRPARFNKPG